MSKQDMNETLTDDMGTERTGVTYPARDEPPPDDRDKFDDVDAAPAEGDAQAFTNLAPVLPRIDLAGGGVAAWEADMPEEMYHADKSAVSSTGTKKLLTDTPAHFYEAWSQPYDEDEDESDARRIGKLLHLALLQPKLYAERVVVAPKFDRRTKVGKEACAAFEKSLPNKAIICDKIEKAQIEAMAMAVLAHPIAGDLLASFSENLRTELTGYFTDPKTGIRCRIRLDGYEVAKDGSRTIIDLKTIRRARDSDIQRAVEEFKYANQAVTYVDGACIIDKIPIDQPPPLYAWIFVEKTAPHACRVLYPDDEMLADAREEREAALATLAKCIAANKWPGYTTTAEPLSRPAWAKKKRKS